MKIDLENISNTIQAGKILRQHLFNRTGNWQSLMQALDTASTNGPDARSEILLSQEQIKGGYLRVCLVKNTTRQKFLVHRLVLETFVGPCSEGMEARHFPDKDPRNCNLENLQWGTKQENEQDKVHHKGTKLTNKHIRRIREAYASGKHSYRQLGDVFGVSAVQIMNIVRLKQWRNA